MNLVQNIPQICIFSKHKRFLCLHKKHEKHAKKLIMEPIARFPILCARFPKMKEKKSWIPDFGTNRGSDLEKTYEEYNFFWPDLHYFKT